MQWPSYEPAPEEIKAMCAEFRKGWSEREHWKRAGYRDGVPPPVEVMRIHGKPGK